MLSGLKQATGTKRQIFGTFSKIAFGEVSELCHEIR